MSHALWYLRRDDAVQGPFAGKLLARQLILGRVAASDLVSTDRVVWQRVGDVPELMPEVMQADLTDPVARQRLLAALRWEDERTGRDRRAGPGYGTPSGDKRRGRERRQVEELGEVDHRLSRESRMSIAAAAWQRSEKQAQRRGLWQIGTLVMVLALAGTLAYFYIPQDSIATAPQCTGVPRPQINWSNCRLDAVKHPNAQLAGAHMPNVQLTRAQLSQADLRDVEASYANLAMADLRGAQVSGANLMGASLRGAVLINADFSGANLAYADFSGAQIRGAKFDKAALSKAIWVDGTVCAAGSVSACLPPPP